jgi:hypothetical protein
MAHSSDCCDGIAGKIPTEMQHEVFRYLIEPLVETVPDDKGREEQTKEVPTITE